MKHPLFAQMTLVGLSTLLVFAPPVFAEEAKPGVITVSATGTATQTPDMAILNLSVVREAATAKEALAQNSAAMRDVLAAMKSAGIEDKDLQTSSFNISPRYDRRNRQNNNQPKRPEIIGYLVQNGLTIRVRKLDELGKIIDQAVQLGVNSGGHVQFTNSNPETAIEEARKDAVAKALAKAETLSDAAGVTIGRIKNISETGRGVPRPLPMARMARAENMDDGAPVAAGENAYRVTVNVTWELNQ